MTRLELIAEISAKAYQEGFRQARKEAAILVAGAYDDAKYAGLPVRAGLAGLYSDILALGEEPAYKKEGEQKS